MNGPEHYREAERLLALAAPQPDGRIGAISEPGTSALIVDRATAHATLAIAAATALGMSDGRGGFEGMRAGDAEAWEAVCSVIADRGPVVPGVSEGHVHDGCEEHYTEPGVCCPHCPGWTVSG